MTVRNFAHLGYYISSSDNFLLIFQDNPSVPSSQFRNPKESLQPQNRVHIGKSVSGENVSVVW